MKMNRVKYGKEKHIEPLGKASWIINEVKWKEKKLNEGNGCTKLQKQALLEKKCRYYCL